jgi:hypothetical protein
MAHGLLYEATNEDIYEVGQGVLHDNFGQMLQLYAFYRIVHGISSVLFPPTPARLDTKAAQPYPTSTQHRDSSFKAHPSSPARPCARTHPPATRLYFHK